MIPFARVWRDLSYPLTNFDGLFNIDEAPKGLGEKAGYAVATGIIQFLTAIVFSIIIQVVFSLFLHTEPENWVSEEVSENPTFFLIVLITLVGPILEEALFRSWLGRIPYWFIGALALCYLVLGFGFSLPTVEELTERKTIALLVVALLPAVLCTLQILRGKYYFTPSRSSVRRLFWITTIVFGLFHAENYVNSEFSLGLALAMSPLLLSPQLAGGYILGVCRIRTGLAGSMLAHCINNSLAAIGIIFAG